MSNLVTVATFHSVHEAQLAKTVLESHGVKSFILDKHVASLQPPLSVGGIRVQVSKEDVDLAKDLLKNL